MPVTAFNLAGQNGDLPHSVDAEQAILGSIIRNPSLIMDASDQLKAEDFYTLSHRRIFIAMKALAKRGAQIDPVLIAEEIKKDGPPSIEMSFILRLSDGCPFNEDIRQYSALLKDTAARRRGLSMSAALEERAKDPSTPLIVSDGTNYFTMRGKGVIGAGGSAPANASYITQVSESGLSAEQAL